MGLTETAGLKQVVNGKPGLAARQLALDIVDPVLNRRQALDDVLETVMRTPDWSRLEPRDRAFARALAMAVLRNSAGLDTVLAPMLQRPLPAEAYRIGLILKLAAAQLLVMGASPHAAIDLAVDQTRAERHGARLTGLVNAVLRRLTREGAATWSGLDHARLATPDWLWQAWTDQYGAKACRAVAVAHRIEPELDVTVKQPSRAAEWAERLGGVQLATGTIRITDAPPIESMPGFAEGAWWIQDAAAALPAQLIAGCPGMAVADLCAAPGGKTAQLAATGAHVVAVDASRPRLARLEGNLQRLQLTADIVHAEVENWQAGRQFDSVLLDAPCSATGTLRRHPDIAQHRRPEDVARHSLRQARLLNTAAELVVTNGVLVFCTCSLQVEEGEALIEPFLARNPAFAIDPIASAESIAPEWLTPMGTLRTLPCHSPGAGQAGMDGFFAVRFRRRG